MTLNNKNASRLVFLDLFRFLAALFVVLYHYTYFLPSGNEGFSNISYITKYGYLGVNFFFMISGFVIYLSIEKKNWIDFISSRFSRLFPAYWFAVLFSASFILIFPEHIKLNLNLVDVLVNLTMFQDFLDMTHVDGVYWTLTIELVFYFWIFIFISLRNLKAAPYFFLCLLLLSLISFFIPLPKLLVSVLLLDWISYFLAGMIFYLFYSKRGNLFWGAVLLLSLIISLMKANKYLVDYGTFESGGYSLLVVTTIIITMYFMFVFLIYYSDFFTCYLNVGFVVFLGGLTYPLYLIHQNVGYIIFSMFDAMNAYLLLMFLMVVMMIVSAFIYLFIENKYQVKLKAMIFKFINFLKVKVLILFLFKVGQ